MLVVTSHTTHWVSVLSASSPSEPSGSWDSIHVFEAAERGRQAHYKLTSTIMLQMTNRSLVAASKDDKSKDGGSGDGNREGEVLLSGSMTRQVGSLISGTLSSVSKAAHGVERARSTSP